jgi:hypothetical protein
VSAQAELLKLQKIGQFPDETLGCSEKVSHDETKRKNKNSL